MADSRQGATGGVTFKTGIVSAVDVAGRVRVRFEDIGLESYWLRVCYPKTHQDKFYWLPDTGEQVECLMDANLEEGVVIGASYSADDVTTWASADVTGIRFQDGSEVSQDRASGKMTINAMGDLEIQVGGQLTVTVAGVAHVKAGGTTLDSDLRVKQATMLEGGVGGADGISTPIPGSVKAQEDVVAGRVSLLEHIHRDSEGGNTNRPE
ncbi:MAG: phage baseplate assembly protein V [Burkholderia gladioli]